ncbi:MAG: hypothetical protein RIC35_12955 [Marinoscillum sp.]
MKSKRSNTWLKQHGSVVRKETEAKRELEEASTNFESQVKRVAVISLVSGLALVAGYGLYKAFSSGKPRVKEQTPPPKVQQNLKPEKIRAHNSFSWKSLVFERIAIIAVNFISAQLAVLLSNKLSQKDDEKD